MRRRLGSLGKKTEKPAGDEVTSLLEIPGVGLYRIKQDGQNQSVCGRIFIEINT